MKRIIFFLFSAWLLTTNVIVFGQTLKPIRKIDKSKIKNERRNFSLNDSISSGSNRTKKINLSAKTTYTDYKVFSFLKETTYIDTTLNIKKHYKFNFLRKDNFGLLPFHNIGQTFNRLTYDFDKLNPVPNIGFTAKHYFYSKYLFYIFL